MESRPELCLLARDPVCGGMGSNGEDISTLQAEKAQGNKIMAQAASVNKYNKNYNRQSGEPFQPGTEFDAQPYSNLVPHVVSKWFLCPQN